ncbi:subtilisin-like protease SBT3.17 [Cucurbita moschata]|uniref:Subtilisin-like protease SBT3.17 n=1 Tax=Cucurbita moschata TaxID=3662 RepID=A0A6J1EE37_CUCMO|nr:subtilisin-like protease SBT3.17 [Cucurbita moschata]
MAINFSVFFFTFSLTFLLTSATQFHKSAPDSAPWRVHIIYTERPLNETPEAYHIRILTSVLGSEEAAREALVYCYKDSINGFAAKLTPDQVENISKQPGVLNAVESRSYHLDSKGEMLT